MAFHMKKFISTIKTLESLLWTQNIKTEPVLLKTHIQLFNLRYSRARELADNEMVKDNQWVLMGRSQRQRLNLDNRLQFLGPPTE
jgi:hypothetical protein